jgi:isopenicillin N synthase-like dioxygenase
VFRATIPVVDLRDFSNADRRLQFVQTLGKGLEEFGFVAVTGHGIPAELLEAAYADAAAVFHLSEAVKRAYETPENGRQRGYTSMGVEHAKDQPVPDLKEFWHVGRELSADHPFALSGQVPANLYPAEVPRFKATFSALYREMETFANTLLEAVGEFLGLPDGTFSQIVQHGNSVLRVINYPDLGGPVPAGAVRAAQHEDINLITVLPASTRPGLELLTRDGTWLGVETPPDVMIVDTGDMMQHLTGGRLPSTTHRVVNPDGADGGRMSMPFFLHPNPDFPMAPFGTHPSGSTATAREFLFRRLREIGVA